MAFYRISVLVIFGFLSSCSNNFRSPPDTIITAITNPISSIDPLFTTDAASQRINQLIHLALVTVNKELTPIPQLAKNYKIINDTTIEFTLLENCKFHNNKSITAKDVEYSINIFQNPKYNSVFQTSFKNIKKIEIIDEYKFRLTTEIPQTNLLYDLSLLKIIPLGAYDANVYQTNPIGGGQYKIKEFSPSGILLERFDNGCMPLPPTAFLHAKVIRDDLSRFLKLKNGEIDIILNDLDYRKVLQIKEQRLMNLTAQVADGTSYSYLGINFANPHLQKLKVRQAIALALNIPELIQYKLVGFAHPSATIIPMNSWYYEPSLVPTQQNIPRAQQLLDEAGYFNGVNDKPSLKLVLKTTTFKAIVDNARAIAEQLKAVGIQIDHKAYEWGTFYSDMKARNTELFLSRWVGISSPEIMRDIFHSKHITENNRTNYINPTLDKLFDQASATVDPVKRKKLFQQAQKIIYTDLPYISLWHNKNFAVFRNNIKDVELLPNGDWSIFLKIRKE